MGRIIEILRFNLIEQRGILLICSIMLFIALVVRVTLNNREKSSVDASKGVIIYAPSDSLLRVDQEVIDRLIND